MKDGGVEKVSGEMRNSFYVLVAARGTNRRNKKLRLGGRGVSHKG